MKGIATEIPISNHPNNSVMKFQFLILYILCFFVQSFAGEGIFAVISAKVSTNERPLLWINRNSDTHNTDLHYFQGPQYHFMALVTDNDTTGVISGQNTAGFAVVYTTALDAPQSSADNLQTLLKRALGTCASVKEFKALLQSAGPFNAIVGCIDHYGYGAVLEADTSGVTLFDVDDPSAAPEGFLVRQQFSMHGSGPVNRDTWCYHRAAQLLRTRTINKSLDLAYLMQVVARDIKSENLDPYPLPFTGQFNKAPRSFVYAGNTINSYRTTDCLVFFGYSTLYHKELPGFLYIPGQPLCGAAVPLWPSSGEIPAALSGKGFTKIEHAINSITQNIYRKSKWPEYLDSKMLTKGKNSRLQQNLNIEKEMLKKITPLPVSDLNALHNLQKEWANRILRALQ